MFSFLKIYKAYFKVICNVLHTRCNQKGLLNEEEAATTAPLVPRGDGMDLKETDLEKISEVLRDYECTFHFLKTSTTKFHPDSLKLQILPCDGRKGADVSHKEFNDKIKNIVGT